MRDKHGAITTIDVPGAGYGTWANSINEEGAIAGYFYDANGVGHGFVRDKHGAITTINAAGGAGGTFANSINEEGAITGYFYDGNGASHGFLLNR